MILHRRHLLLRSADYYSHTVELERSASHNNAYSIVARSPEFLQTNERSVRSRANLSRRLRNDRRMASRFSRVSSFHLFGNALRRFFRFFFRPVVQDNNWHRLQEEKMTRSIDRTLHKLFIRSFFFISIDRICERGERNRRLAFLLRGWTYSFHVDLRH